MSRFAIFCMIPNLVSGIKRDILNPERSASRKIISSLVFNWSMICGVIDFIVY